MPVFTRRPPKAPKPAVDDELPAWLKAFFMTGEKPVRDTPEFHEYVQARYFSHKDKVSAAWKKHGEALVRECARERPGTRPFYFWLADVEDDFNDFPVENEPRESYRARLEAHDRESEASILRRRGLLLPGEAKRIPRAAFEPLTTLPAVWNVDSVTAYARAVMATDSDDADAPPMLRDLGLLDLVAAAERDELPGLVRALDLARDAALARLLEREPTRLLTPEDAAQLVSLPERRLRSLARGKAWALRVGGALRIDEAALLRWARRSQCAGNRTPGGLPAVSDVHSVQETTVSEPARGLRAVKR